MEIVLPILIIILFIILGIMLSLGKGSFLIAGFNTMSKEEKAQYDVPSLCKFMGKFMFVVAFSISLFLLSDILAIKDLFYAGNLLLIGSVIFILIYMNTGNRFKKNRRK